MGESDLEKSNGDHVPSCSPEFRHSIGYAGSFSCPRQLVVCKPPYKLHPHCYEVGRQFLEVHRGPPRVEMDKGPAACSLSEFVSLMVDPYITNQALRRLQRSAELKLMEASREDATLASVKTCNLQGHE